VEGGAPFRITDVPIQFAAAQLERPDGGQRLSDNKNVLYLIIGVLAVAVAVLVFNLYQAKQQPDGLQINVGPDGVKIRNK
jgi:RsiW-degrading membrane proteinase PrsW (M82 family)